MTNFMRLLPLEDLTELDLRAYLLYLLDVKKLSAVSYYVIIKSNAPATDIMKADIYH
jgi:hypothetical protein